MENTDEAFDSTVYDAAESGDIERLNKVLVSHSHLIDVCNQRYNNRTPLHIAACMGHVFVIEALVQSGSKAIDIPNKYGCTPMYIAAHQGHVLVIELLVRLGSTAIDTPDNDSWPPMLIAARNGHASVIETLVRLGSTAIDTPINRCGWTPMLVAAHNGHMSVIEALVRLGSTAIDSPDKFKRTPMHMAAQEGHVSVINTLVRLGSTAIDTPNNNNWTPTYTAAWHGHVLVIETLLRLEFHNISTVHSPIVLPPIEVLRSKVREKCARILAALDYKTIVFNPPTTIESMSEDEILEIRYRICFDNSLVSKLLQCVERNYHYRQRRITSI